MMCESVPFSREKQTGNVFILGDNSIFRKEDSQREVAFATAERRTYIGNERDEKFGSYLISTHF